MLNLVLSHTGSSAEKINVECWEVLLSKCFHGNDLEADGQLYSSVSTLLSLEEVSKLRNSLGHLSLNLQLSLTAVILIKGALLPKIS